MATAIKKYTGVSYTLTLNEDEARTLRTILNRVGGVPERTPRRHSDAINTALRSQGADELEDARFSDMVGSGLYFAS